MKALIVDDEPDIWFLLNNLLRKHRIPTRFVSSLAAARQALQSDHFGLVFLDNRLPDGFGLDFITFLKAHYPATRIAMITGYETATAGNLATTNGADYFIAKPFGLAQVESVLTHCLV